MSKIRPINPNGLYHVYNRGNNKESIFIDDSDKAVFLKILKKHLKKAGIIIIAYCIMNNHFHIFLQLVSGNLFDFMRDIQARYSEYFNNKYNRSGHVFQGPYGCQLVIGLLYCIKLVRYILRNPFKAGIVKLIRAYKWSSLGSSNLSFSIADNKYVEILFDNADVDFETYINNNEDDFLIAAIEKRIFKFDEAVEKYREILKNKFNLLPEDFLKQETDLKFKIIIWCRYIGISIRQLKEITGAEISFIRRAIPKDIEYL